MHTSKRRQRPGQSAVPIHTARSKLKLQQLPRKEAPGSARRRRGESKSQGGKRREPTTETCASCWCATSRSAWWRRTRTRHEIGRASCLVLVRRHHAPGLCPYCGGGVVAADVESAPRLCYVPLCFRIRRRFYCSLCSRRLVSVA